MSKTKPSNNENGLGLRKLARVHRKRGKVASFPRIDDLHGPKYGAGPASIYALVDPLDRTVRYIGKTEKPLDVRLAEHLAKPSNEHTRAWMRTLALKGLRPEIVLLTTSPLAHWKEAESGWIAYAARRGRLYNMDPGGRVRGADGKLTAAGAWKRATLDRRRAHREDAHAAVIRRQRREFFAAVKSGELRVWTPAEIAAREAEVKSNSKRVRFTPIRGEGSL